MNNDNVIEQTALKPLVGQMMPDFRVEVFHQNEFKHVSLADFKGKFLILFFYPADFTFVCPTELRSLIDLYPEFVKLNAEVIGVSTDTVFTHKAWIDHSPLLKGLSFPLAGDPNGRLTKSLGVYLEEEGLALRASFIIDPKGIIKACEIHDNGIGRNAQELLRKLQATAFVYEHGSEVCPANWHPGEATLKPGIDLVGKI